MPPDIKADTKPYKRKSDDRWVAVAHVNGKRHTFTSKVLATAVDKRRAFIRDKEDGITASTDKTKLSQWLDRWLQIKANKMTRPSTLSAYQSRIESHIKPAIGHRVVSKLTPDDVTDLHAYMHKAGVGTGTIRNTHGILFQALREAMRIGITHRNVASLVDRPTYAPKGRGAYEAHEARQFLEHARANNDPYAELWELRLYTGARKGETLGLTVDRVDFDNLTVDFSWQLQSVPYRHGCEDESCGETESKRCPQRDFKAGEWYERQHLRGSQCLVRPKTDSSRRVTPITQQFADRLRAHLDRTPPNPWGLVWVSPRGLPIRPTADDTSWYAALTAAGVSIKTVHASRHTASTLMQEAGVEEAVRMKIMGHSSHAAARGYLHIKQQESRAAYEALSNLINLGPDDYTVEEAEVVEIESPKKALTVAMSPAPDDADDDWITAFG